MLSTARAVLWKDLRIELRTKEALAGSFVFCAMVLTIFNFTLDVSTADARRLAPAFFWVAFAFGGTLSLNRSSALELANGCSRGLVMAPVDRGGVFLGKFAASVVSMLLAQLFLLPLFVVFFDVSFVDGWLKLAASFLLGAVAFSSVGTVFAAVAFQTRMRELLLPVLLLPAVLPALIAAVQTTADAAGAASDATFWWRLLIVYDVIGLVTSFLIFGYVLEE